MKPRNILVGTGALILLTFGLACRSNSNIAVSVEPTPLPYSTGTPYAVRQKLINESGWPIPSTVDFKLTTKSETTIRSVDGRPIRVETKHLRPNGESVYIAPPMPNGVSSRMELALDVDGLAEFSVKGKVYLYEIMVEPQFNRGPSSPNTNRINGLLFIFQLVDQDGDGKFETMFDKQADVPVPRWASRL